MANRYLKKCTTSLIIQFSSVQSLSRVRLFATHESQQARPPCPSPTPGVHSDSRPSSQLCHPAISPSVVPFSSCPQSLPASESFPMSQLFTWGRQSTGVSALASFLPKKSQEETQIKTIGEITSLLLGWLLSERWKMTSVGDEVEKRKPWHTNLGTINWCSH